MTGILLSPDGPVGPVLEAATAAITAGREVVVFLTHGSVEADGRVPIFSAADAYAWRGRLVATCGETLRVALALPRPGGLAIDLADPTALSVGWSFRALRAALEETTVTVPTRRDAARFCRTWGLIATPSQ